MSSHKKTQILFLICLIITNYGKTFPGTGRKYVPSTVSCAPGSQTYSTSGLHTFTVPAGCSSFTIETWGAGGGSGSSNSGSGGGGGGAYAASTYVITADVTAFRIEVGLGSFGNGGDTTVDCSETVKASGGGPDLWDSSGGAASNSIGTVKYSGGDGGGQGWGGGSSAGTSSAGTSGVISVTVGATAPAGGGNGGNAATASAAATAGSDPGGGGGGGCYSASSTCFGGVTYLPGGSGGNGKVELTYTGGPTTYSTPGIYIFTVPGGVTSITAAAWGAGAGGSYYFGVAGPSGGGGAYAESVISVTPGEKLTINVGAGGVSMANVPPQPGDISSVTHCVQIKAAGGTAGNLRTGGAGGTTAASVGTTLYAGGSGGTSSGANAGGAGGGGSAGPSSNGNPGSANTTGTGGAGAVAVTGGGVGGNGGNNGADGNLPVSGNGGGGGGNGKSGSNTGEGAHGKVVITY